MKTASTSSSDNRGPKRAGQPGRQPDPPPKPLPDAPTDPSAGSATGSSVCPPGLFITDLDGTLFRSDRTASETDLETLETLGRKGFVRAVATGRSLFSFKKAVGDSLPVDYVIFSTGAGIVRYPQGQLLKKTNMDPATVAGTRKILTAAGLCFMIHQPVPDNHHFTYWRNGTTPADFTRRIELYEQYCRPLRTDDDVGEAAQFLAIVSHSEAEPVIESLRPQLPEINIVRTTSPLDGKSTWIEFFRKDVSKSQAAAWLAARLNIPREKTVSVGNDYNDTDLLAWSGASFVVDNAADDIKERFPTVASHDECGVTEAAERWMRMLKD